MNGVAVEPQKDFPKDRAIQYLRVYNADIDWAPHIDDLYNLLKKKSNNSEEEAKRKIKQHISFTILAPLSDPHMIKDPYHRMLFGCSSFTGFNDRDWEQELREIWDQDVEIEKVRQQLISMGIIHPIEYVPMTRQAFKWLTERVPEGEGKENSYGKMQNLVFAYGGSAICNIFMKPEYETKISKIINWRTGYFFERLIHEVYKPEQLMKIKEHELNKVDSKLVKKIRLNK